MRAFYSELDVMARLRHPNILLFMGACVRPGQLMLVMDYLPRGSLAQLLHSAEPLALDLRMRMCRDVAAGMAWLHAHKPAPIVHRDLKPENCLVAQNYTVVVCDFGIAQVKAFVGKSGGGTGQGCARDARCVRFCFAR